MNSISDIRIEFVFFKEKITHLINKFYPDIIYEMSYFFFEKNKLKNKFYPDIEVTIFYPDIEFTLSANH